MDEWPVFLVQANFIRGGLLLTCTLQHQVGDMTALGEVMSLFHKACKGEAFIDEELRLANVDRTDVIPIHDAAWLEVPCGIHFKRCNAVKLGKVCRDMDS